MVQVGSTALASVEAQCIPGRGDLNSQLMFPDCQPKVPVRYSGCIHGHLILIRKGGPVTAVGLTALPQDGETARIGARLKAVRRSQRRTLEDVAESSGLTKGFLSKIERDLAAASVAALLRICTTLGIPLASLFESDSTGEVVRAGQYPRIDFGGQDLEEYQLTPFAEQRIQVLRSDIRPGGGSGAEGYTLPAEVEFVYVITGRVAIGFADRTIELGPGDAFTFDPGVTHTFRAEATDEVTTVLWMLCPALAAGNPAAAEHDQDTITPPAAYATRIIQAP